ncbi:MAG: hypothetical protein ACD_39C00750G0003 [uncultured bacterium]|nr:MAG: hypothetical protein ACD_39C00750G0003 [uncultured bacterium]
MGIIQYSAVFLLLTALLLLARKSYTWMIAAALVMFSGSRVIELFDIPPDWIEFGIAQLAAGSLMVAGHLLRHADSTAFRLFYRARLHGTKDFTRTELVKLLGFAALAKQTVMNVTMIICLLTAGAAMTVEFIESDSSPLNSQITLLGITPPAGEITADSAATADSPVATNLSIPRLPGFPEVLFPVFLPLLVGLIIAQFLVRVQDSSWFSALTPADLQREPVELPSYLWFFPALSVLLAWSEKFFAFLATF